MINIAKLLKDAPEGMKLYSPLFGEVKFKYINGSKFGIVVEDSEECYRSFDKYGRYFTIYNNAECLLFPSKDCRTWEGWKLPLEPKFKVGDWVACIDDDGDIATEKIASFSHNKVLLVDTNGCHTEYPKTELSNFHLWTIADAKDGDVLATDNDWTCIFQAFDGCGFSSYCFMDSQRWFCESGSEAHTLDSRINGNIHPATKEQRDLLFRKMKEAGYEWDADKKELRKIQPHYDIANFKPFDKVLVRDADDGKWRCNWFSHYSGDGGVYRFVTTKCGYAQCIPFEGNEHLLGTTDMPDEMYINW